MKKDNKETQTFISRMPLKMHKELRFISMYTGQTMQDIGNYAIQKEIELFKSQIPALKELSEQKIPKQEKDSENHSNDIIDTKPTQEELSVIIEEDDKEKQVSINSDTNNKLYD